MGSDEVTNSPESPLQQLCDRAKLGDESKMLLTDELSTKQFLGLLIEKELFQDAIRLVATCAPSGKR